MRSLQTLSANPPHDKETLSPEKRSNSRDGGSSLKVPPSSVKALFLTSILSLCAFLFGTFSIFPLMVFGNTDADKPEKIGIVLTENLNLRKAPRLSARSIRKLKKGTEVKILEHREGWLKVKLNDQIGYVSHQKKFIKVITQKKSGTNSTATPSERKKGDQFKQKVEDIERNLQKRKDKLQTIIRKETDILNSLDTIDRSIDQGKKRIAAYKKELKRIAKEIAAYNETRKEQEKKIRVGEYYNTKRLVALYKLDWTGKINMLASAGSVYEIIERKSALEKILAYDENNRLRLVQNRDQLKTLVVELNKNHVEKRATESAQKKQMEVLIRKRSTRQFLLSSIREKKTLERAAVSALQASAEALHKKLMALETENNAPPSPKKSPDKSFSTYKGLLRLPVKGKIVNYFGPYIIAKFNAKNFRSGIDIQAARGNPVYSVNAGVVIFSSWFKGYGNMIVIDHGKNYYTVYAHLEDVFKKKGDVIEGGETIATVGDTGSMIGPKLYFEIRHHGKPLDPMDWLKS